jgi:hypothetical protein
LAKKGAAARAGLDGKTKKAEKQSAFRKSRPPKRRRRAGTCVKKKKLSPGVGFASLSPLVWPVLIWQCRAPINRTALLTI